MGGKEDKPNVKEWETAAKILDHARERVEKMGWQQGAEQAVSQECLATALEHAFFDVDTKSIVDFNYAMAAVNKELSLSSDAFVLTADKSLEVPYWGSALMEWNDNKARTKEEVINVLAGAADQARQRSKAAAAPAIGRR